MTSPLPSKQTSLLLQIIQRPALSDVHFRRICQLIYQHVGTVLANHKRDMVYNHLVRRLHILGLDDFGRYLSMLEVNQNSSEQQAFINPLIANLIVFLHKGYHFPVLSDHTHRRGSEYRVWNAVASTEEEPYGIVIVLVDILGTAPGRWRIFASNIDTEVLEKTRNDIYRLGKLKTLSPQQLQCYFMRGTGPHEGLVCARQELTDHVEFSSVNLLDKQYNAPGPFDAIFCRNMMIYSDETT